MLKKVKLSILSENRVVNPRLRAEQGFSVYIETENGTVLFDVGQTDALVENAREMNIDLKSVQKIVLSHGHYDHTGGLPFVLKQMNPIDVICHPALSNKKYKIHPAGRTNIGVPWEKRDMISQGARFIYKTHPFEVLPDVWISGEIPRRSSFEYVEETYQQKPSVSYIHDEIHDDQCLVLNTVKGLIILLGCGHAGPINSIKQSMRVTKNKKIYAVVGGMHLQHSPDEKIKKIVKNLCALDPEYVLPLHCTGFNAITRFITVFEQRVKLLNVGDTFELSG
jgi:7,8-dihydropterin-6-yl-methyl-4-(beta-D-ribofuranosyl)aminobenzene 5'-phosphate synthase